MLRTVYLRPLCAPREHAGEFVVYNKHLVKDLVERDLWDDQMRNDLLRHEGSVQPISRVPDDLKALYKTAWEIKLKTLIDQSQSLSAFLAAPDYQKLTTFHFYGWKNGLKTGMYYLRTKPAATALRFTLEPPPQQPAASPTRSRGYHHYLSQR